MHAWIAPLDRVDVLVNNAGGGFEAAFLDVSEKGQDALDPRELRERHALHPRVRAEDAGRRVVRSSTSRRSRRTAPRPGYAVYSAMKAALVNLSQSLALELGDRRIRVNCIAPDVIPTPGIGGDLPVKTPLPYAGHVDDVAAAALYLASDWSRFVTGSTIHVDGGNLAAGGWGRGAGGGVGHRRRTARVKSA